MPQTLFINRVSLFVKHFVGKKQGFLLESEVANTEITRGFKVSVLRCSGKDRERNNTGFFLDLSKKAQQQRANKIFAFTSQNR